MRHAPQALVFGPALSLVVGFSALATDGATVDLTGTWQGAQVCDDFAGGEFSIFTLADNPLLVVQDGDKIRFVSAGSPPNEIADDLVYEGLVQPVEDGSQAEALASICGGDYEAQETVRLRRITVSADGGHFDADSIFFTDDYPQAKGILIFETCKWAYERVSTTPPSVPACQRPGIQRTQR
jgi:hypothetical protein